MPYERCGDYRIYHDAPRAERQATNGAYYEMTDDKNEEIKRLQDEGKVELANKQTKEAKFARASCSKA